MFAAFRLSLGKNYLRKFVLKPQFHNHSRNVQWNYNELLLDQVSAFWLVIMKKGFMKPPILAFRRDKNLKDILVHKKHNSMFFKQEHKCVPCSRNCAINELLLDQVSAFWLVINLTNVFGTGYLCSCLKNRELCFLWTKISFKFLSRVNAKIGGFMNPFFYFLRRVHKTTNFSIHTR
jgi:hypothetical protein